MIKAIFFDVDGTLYSHTQNCVPASTLQAFASLHQRGIQTIIATGRHWSELSKLPVMSLGFDGYLTLNGQLLLDANHQFFAGNPIDRREMEIVVSIFTAKQIPFVLIGETTRYINYVNHTVIDTQLQTKGTVPDIGQYKGEDIYQCLAFVPDKERQLLDHVLDKCAITSWHDTGIDIIPKGGGKAKGIELYLEKAGLDRSEVMAFGDGENDMDMLQYAGIGVAMGNAGDRVKACADYVTDSIDEDGLAHALQHFGLIEGDTGKYMSLQLKETSDSLYIHLQGRLDTTSAPDLENTLEPYWDRPLDFIFDFSDLDFITSSGLRVLLRARKTRDKLNHHVTIRSINEAIAEVFALTGFNDLFDIV